MNHASNHTSNHTSHDETILSLTGSYSADEFLAALDLPPVSINHLDATAAHLNAVDQPTVLIWHNFHGAQVGDQSSTAMAAWLRKLAHQTPHLRLVFFDEEGEGQ